MAPDVVHEQCRAPRCVVCFAADSLPEAVYRAERYVGGPGHFPEAGFGMGVDVFGGPLPSLGGHDRAALPVTAQALAVELRFASRAVPERGNCLCAQPGDPRYRAIRPVEMSGQYSLRA